MSGVGLGDSRLEFGYLRFEALTKKDIFGPVDQEPRAAGALFAALPVIVMMVGMQVMGTRMPEFRG